MADLDDEMLERVRQWCAEAGRQTGAAEIRAALTPLGWDELLNVRALLADPPPARPLGPAALADLARGTPADVAAEREREGRYRPEETETPARPAGDDTGPRPAARARRAGSRRPAPPVVHRRRDAAPAAAPPSPSIPALDELRLPPGRTVLEQLIRKQGARRSFLLSALAGWRRADGAPPDDADLSDLLDHHGLARAFAHRERDELLHALRAARGERAAGARAVGLSPEAFQAALERLGATADAERIREDRRAELRSHATLAERSRLLAQEPDRVADLGLLEELEADLKARLPEHLRALRAGRPAGALLAAFARSVTLPEPDARTLAQRLGLPLDAGGRSTRRAPAASGGRKAAARRPAVRRTPRPPPRRGRKPGKA